MPVKTGRKLPRARVDAKVAQAAVRLARHVPAAPSAAGSAKAHVPSTPSQVTLNLTQTPPARPSTEAQAHTPTSPLNAEVADLLERLAADATPSSMVSVIGLDKDKVAQSWFLRSPRRDGLGSAYARTQRSLSLIHISEPTRPY